jgi:hypothetical protein
MGWEGQIGAGGFMRLATVSLLVLVASIAVLAQPAAVEAAPPYPEAVLLVSGFETETPFSTPAPTCNGKEGSEWNPPGGIARALKGAGNDVFTAPVSKTNTPVPASCAGAGEPLPSAGMVIDSNGGTDANGGALAELIAFLRDSYGISDLHIVAHSEGGLWSRAGITQNAAYAGVTIQSVTTLGTPHTGSYLADLAIELDGGKCDFSDKVEQRICDALVTLADLIVIELGPAATRELTNDFLATWNPRQTIGNCPVSGIAGDHVNFGIPFLGYYTPSDGLVGLASAQAKQALDIDGHLIPAPDIPDFREAGVYDVVHGASVSFLSKKNLLNQPQISEQVTDNTLLVGSQPCNLAAAAAGAGASAAESAQRLRAPLYRMVAADRGGRLPSPGPEDFALSKRRVNIRCGFNEVEPIPLLGDRRLRVHNALACDDRLRARNGSGKGLAQALLLRSHPQRHVLVRVEGDQARIRVRGRAPRSFRAQIRAGGSWQTLGLSRKGRTKLPSAAGDSLRLRIRARGRAQGVPADTAHLTLSR